MTEPRDDLVSTLFLPVLFKPCALGLKQDLDHWNPEHEEFLHGKNWSYAFQVGI